MKTFEEISETIKEMKKMKTDSEVANFLNMEKSNFSQRKKDNKIPYKQIIEKCLKENIDINKIFGNSGILSHDKEINKYYYQLTTEEQELYLSEIKARVLRRKIR